MDAAVNHLNITNCTSLFRKLCSTQELNIRNRSSKRKLIYMRVIITSSPSIDNVSKSYQLIRTFHTIERRRRHNYTFSHTNKTHTRTDAHTHRQTQHRVEQSKHLETTRMHARKHTHRTHMHARAISE